MRFKERNDLANRCKEWIKDQIENNITIPFDTVHLVLAYLDVNGYLNEVVRCCDADKGDCMFNHWHETPNGEKYHICNLNQLAFSEHDDFYCAYGERRDKEMPTADVVEVVRCRDCTWWKSIFSWNGKEHKVCVRDASEPPREQNDFCSYGERSEE